MAKRTEAQQLASLAAAARAELADTGRALHDDVGPLLAGAGLFLSTAPDDPAVKQALEALDQAMERVRALSQQLNPTPADRMGLEKALLRLQEQNSNIAVDYAASAKLPRPAAAAVYDAVAAAVEAAQRARAKRVHIEVSGEASLQVLVRDNGRRGKRDLSVPRKLAEASGLRMTVTTRNDTIVSIAYGLRRTAGR